MRKVQFLFFIGLLLLVSSVFATQRMVVGELFSSASCPACPPARSALKQLDDNVDNLVPLLWAGGSPHGQERYELYNGGGVPHAQFGGSESVVGASATVYNDYLGEYNDIVDVDSPIDLSFDFTIAADGNVTFAVDAEMTSDIATTNNKIIYVVTRYISDSYFCNVVLYEEENFTLTTTGDTQTFNRSIALPTTMDPTNIKGVVIVQSLNADDNLVVHQAAISEYFQPNATISGTVTNGFDNSNMAGVDVYAGDLHAVTGADGTFSFEFVAPFPRLLKIAKYGYSSVFETINLVPDDNISRAIVLNEIVIAPKYAESEINYTNSNVTLTWEAPGFLDEFRETFDDTTHNAFEFRTNTQSAGWQIMTSSSSQYFTIPMLGSYFVGVNDDAGGQNGGPNADGSMDYMIMPAVDLSKAFDAQLTFMSYYTGQDNQYALIEISTDGGTSWVVAAFVPPAVGWGAKTIDLTDYCGPGYESALIAFHSFDGGGWGSGWGVDDIVLNSAGGNNPAFHGYNLYLDGADSPVNGNTPLTTLTYTFDNLAVGEHTVEIAAVYDTGESDYFSYTFVLPPEQLFPPTNVAYANVGNLSWEPPLIPVDREFVGYKVYLDDTYVASTTETHYHFEGITDQTAHTAAVTAEYTDNYESEKVEVSFTYDTDNDNNGINKFTTGLAGNFPNPFNPETNVRFSLKETAEVTLEVYSVRGQKVKTLARNRLYNAGDNTETWNGTDDNSKSVASGVYFLKMTTKDYSKISKMVLMK